MEEKVKLAAAYYSFLIEHLHMPVGQFVLKYAKSHANEIGFFAQQLNGLQRAQKKLPTWFVNEKILYPPQLNLEQSSSEITAKYKAGLLPQMALSADLTGGFGIDSYYISQKSKRHFYIEQNQELANYVKANFWHLAAENVDVLSFNSIDWLFTQNEKFEAIYIDPSRRVGGAKKFIIEECEPNVVQFQKQLLEKTERLIIKLSPLADIKSIIKALPLVKEIHIISVKNECKEILAILTNEQVEKVELFAVDIDNSKNTSIFNFSIADEQNTAIGYSKAFRFLYEPNASILKSGAFKLVAQRFHLKKLHPNTHLYTADNELDSFPGRCFEIVEERFTKANIISKNHPLTPSKLAQKYKVQEGSENDFLLAFTDLEKPKLVFAKRRF